MSLRQALLVTLLDGEATGYELSKRFDIAASNFWNAQQAQLYAELIRMEADGLVEATTVVQTKRPNKRLVKLTEAGIQAIREFAQEPSPRTSLKDELMIKATGIDVSDAEAFLDDLSRRREISIALIDRYETSVRSMFRGRDEDTFVRTTRRVGPYLTLLRGISLERDNVAWCDETKRIVTARLAMRGASSEHRVNRTD